MVFPSSKSALKVATKWGAAAGKKSTVRPAPHQLKLLLGFISPFGVRN